MTTETSYLPPPKQFCIVKMSEMEVAEMIERHIDYVDKNGRSVHLPTNFVRHYMRRDDGVLPTIVAVSQLPIVLGDGNILAPKGLDRPRGILFRIPPELMKHLPDRSACTPDAVRAAFDFLMNEWLVDVLADFQGKCTIIAAALTLIERSMLPDRPVFFITAGRRGSGKTTVLHMLAMAIAGTMAPAAAWSSNEEERRKALLSYLMAGLAFVIWDNIPRGMQIGCPHIERACTTALYTDRKLGVSEMVATAASTIMLFTGNNIGPKGDLASRSLTVRLEVDRADPENREFTHNDGIGWTEAHRGQIMAALYTIILGNPFLRTPIGTECKTRFKVWWRLVGSALEHAAELAGHSLDFKKLFLSQEEDDEESGSLAEAFAAMAVKFGPGKAFKAADVAAAVNDRSDFSTDLEHNATIRDFLFPNAAPGQIMSAKAVAKALKKHVGAPVQYRGETLVLREGYDSDAKTKTYSVKVS